MGRCAARQYMHILFVLGKSHFSYIKGRWENARQGVCIAQKAINPLQIMWQGRQSRKSWGTAVHVTTLPHALECSGGQARSRSAAAAADFPAMGHGKRVLCTTPWYNIL